MANKSSNPGLKTWQKEISQGEYLEGIQKDGAFAGFGYNSAVGKFYKTDMNHPDKIKSVRAKEKRREEKKAKASGLRAKLRDKIKALKAQVKEVKKTAYERGKAVGHKAGMRDAKPKKTLEERMAKAKERMAKEQAKIEALKAKQKSA